MAEPACATVIVQEHDIDVGEAMTRLQACCPEAGAMASFLGIVRSTPERPIAALTLEHYPAMTQPALAALAETAIRRFELLGCTVVHRYGRLLPGDRIVLVLAAAHHRRRALDATAFLIDWLKTQAPFWKKEHGVDGSEAWVGSRAEDDEAVAAW